jgi:6-pyruvoyltetrahydropterin/6-carboxytetrahydropterin synthase
VITDSVINSGCFCTDGPGDWKSSRLEDDRHGLCGKLKKGNGTISRRFNSFRFLIVPAAESPPKMSASPISTPDSFRVQLQKEQLVFSAAHFITFAGDICECLHGHNYGVKAEVEGPLDENQYVIDFIAFRDNLAEIVKRLDHHVILPTQHPLIHVQQTDGEVVTTFRDKRWVFPSEDCMLLPIGNTTAELLAWWIANQLKSRLKERVPNLHWLEVSVDENHGQWGHCRITW